MKRTSTSSALNHRRGFFSSKVCTLTHTHTLNLISSGSDLPVVCHPFNQLHPPPLLLPSLHVRVGIQQSWIKGPLFQSDRERKSALEVKTEGARAGMETTGLHIWSYYKASSRLPRKRRHSCPFATKTTEPPLSSCFLLLHAYPSLQKKKNNPQTHTHTRHTRDQERRRAQTAESRR